MSPKGGPLRSFDDEVLTDPSGSGICDNVEFGPDPGLIIGKPGAATKEYRFQKTNRYRRRISCFFFCVNIHKRDNLRPGKGGGSRFSIDCGGIRRPETGGGTPSGGGMKLPPSTPIGASSPTQKYPTIRTHNEPITCKE